MDKMIEHIRQHTEAIKQARAAGIGEVGIFWFFKGEIIADPIPHTLGEDYGDFVNGKSDHFRYWRNIQRIWPVAARYEYDQVPRGRVVYRKTDGTFLVYGSERFVGNDRQKAVVISEFHLPPDKIVFKADEHYARVPGMIEEESPDD